MTRAAETDRAPTARTEIGRRPMSVAAALLTAGFLSGCFAAPIAELEATATEARFERVELVDLADGERVRLVAEDDGYVLIRGADGADSERMRVWELAPDLYALVYLDLGPGDRAPLKTLLLARRTNRAVELIAGCGEDPEAGGDYRLAESFGAEIIDDSVAYCAFDDAAELTAFALKLFETHEGRAFDERVRRYRIVAVFKAAP